MRPGLLRDIRCFFKGCPGDAVTGWRNDGALVHGFRCRDCGKVSHQAEGSIHVGRASVEAQRALSREADPIIYWEPPNV